MQSKKSDGEKICAIILLLLFFNGFKADAAAFLPSSLGDFFSHPSGRSACSPFGVILNSFSFFNPDPKEPPKSKCPFLNGDLEAALGKIAPIFRTSDDIPERPMTYHDFLLSGLAWSE